MASLQGTASGNPSFDLLALPEQCPGSCGRYTSSTAISRSPLEDLTTGVLATAAQFLSCATTPDLSRTQTYAR